LPLLSSAARVSAASALSHAAWLLGELVLVDADDHLLATIDARLALCRGLLDAHLRHARFDRLGHATHGLDLVDHLARLVDQRGGQALDVVGTGQRVDHLGDARLLLQHQLGVARDARREIGRQSQRLVEGVGVQRLGAAERRGHRLDGGAHDVVVGILRGQAHARGLAVGAQHQRALIVGRELLLHQRRPQQSCSAQLGHLHEEVHADGEEERQPRRELVDVETAGDRRAHVFDAVGDGVGEFLCAGRPGFLHVVAGDRDGVELRHVRRRVADDVGDDAHRWRRWVDVGVADHELLENVVLQRAGELVRRHALLLGGDDVHRHHRQHRTVHGHRYRHLVERDAVEQDLHVGDAVDRDRSNATDSPCWPAARLRR
jgi:hypothetical protein